MEKETALEVQQYFASLYANIDSRDLIFWDMYEREQKSYLADKIKLLIPDETSQVDFDDILKDKDPKTVDKIVVGEMKRIEKANNERKKQRDELVEKIWDQRIYCGGNILMSIVFVLCTKELPRDSITEAQSETTYSIHPLFRVRKCQNGDNSTSCCMIFVDEDRRVYRNWEQYKTTNNLPKGVVVAPVNGVYNFNVRDNVNLEYFLTPACSIIRDVVSIADTGSGILGIGAAVVTAATLFTPIGAAALIGATAVGGASSLYGMGRSVGKLVDRGTHEQSINVTNREARSSWIGVAGGVIGMAASGVTQGFTRYVSGGNQVSKITRGVVNGLNIAAITTNSFGAGNGLLEIILKYQDGDDITTMDIADLGISLFLVTHSVYNFQTASKIIKASENNSIDAFKKSLSKRMKKRFNKMVRETGNVNEARAKIDVIRGLNNAPTNTSSNIFPKAVALGSAITPAVFRVAQDLINRLISGEKVLDWEYLKSTIADMLYHYSVEVLERLIGIAKQFVRELEQNVEEILRRHVPFEQYLNVAFRVYNKDSQMANNVKDYIYNLDAKQLMDDMYSYFLNCNTNQGTITQCKTCSGWYTLATNI